MAQKSDVSPLCEVYFGETWYGVSETSEQVKELIAKATAPEKELWVRLTRDDGEGTMDLRPRAILGVREWVGSP